MRERLKEALRFDGSTKLRADEQKHHLRRKSEARWPNASKPCDLKTTEMIGAVPRQLRREGLCSYRGGPTLRWSDVSGSVLHAVGNRPVRKLVYQALAYLRHRQIGAN